MINHSDLVQYTDATYSSETSEQTEASEQATRASRLHERAGYKSERGNTSDCSTFMIQSKWGQLTNENDSSITADDGDANNANSRRTPAARQEQVAPRRERLLRHHRLVEKRRRQRHEVVQHLNRLDSHK